MKRAEVALVAFRGTAAELLLPPTRSLARARRSLAELPGGGGTPLAAGLNAARELAEAARARGRTPFVVVLTDGRANIAADGTAVRARRRSRCAGRRQGDRRGGDRRGVRRHLRAPAARRCGARGGDARALPAAAARRCGDDACRRQRGTARMSAPRWEVEGRDWPNRAHSRFVDAGRLRWHVQVWGEGPVLLLLHGTGAATHSWRALAPLLAEHFTVVAPDLPGHGFTTGGPAGGLAMPAMARAVGELLRTMDLAPHGSSAIRPARRSRSAWRSTA